ncbi:hypothetical protein JCM11491_002960 [Sporobolomyces phaffii]
MSFGTLPCEVIDLVVSALCPEAFASLSHAQYLDRTAQLCVVALVHPRWTRPAQRVLHRDVWLTEADAGLARKGRQIARTAERYGYPTRELMVEGTLAVLVSVTATTSRAWWRFVTRLEHVDWDTSVDLTVYDHFPLLETLSIACHSCERPNRSASLSLAHLSRLVFRCEGEFRGLSSLSSAPLWSPTSVPRLRHVALEIDGARAWVDLFDPIVRNVETLAVSDELTASAPHPDFLLLRGVESRPPPPRSLREVAVSTSFAPEFLVDFLTTTRGYDLAALHVALPSTAVEHDEDDDDPADDDDEYLNVVIPRLAAIATAGGSGSSSPSPSPSSASFRAKRVVVYGLDRSSLDEADRGWRGLDAIEWRTADEFPFDSLLSSSSSSSSSSDRTVR